MRRGIARLIGCTLLLLLAAVSQLASASLADDATVPIDLQVDLLDRVVRFERNYSARVTDAAVVIVVHKAGVTASARAAARVAAELAHTLTLGSREVATHVHSFSSLDTLAEACRGAAIVYFMPGFTQSELRAMVPLFVGTGVITVGADENDADYGATLGFELVSARPRIVVNLTQAREQRLDFSAQLLRLARVVQ